MTASCPCCGGKWDIEGEHWDLLLRCGDEHDIKCYYCDREIEFVIEREYLEEHVYIRQITKLVDSIEVLERRLKKYEQEDEKT